MPRATRTAPKSIIAARTRRMTFGPFWGSKADIGEPRNDVGEVPKADLLKLLAPDFFREMYQLYRDELICWLSR